MAELTEQQESPVGENKHPPRSRGGFWFGATVLLLVFGLAGAGFFLFSQLRAKQEGLNGEVKNEMLKQLGGYQNQLVEIEKHLGALQAEIAGKDAHFTKTVDDFSRRHDDKLENTRKELNDSIVRLQRQLGKTRGDWLIADAEYLLSVANERLYLIGDVNTTRQALEAADQRLRESGDASAFKVRDQVIKDIAALTPIQPLDVVGMHSAIQSLEERINNLVLLLPYAGKAPGKTDTQTAPESTGGGGLLESAKHKLSEIVTIKHTDKAVKEILTPEQAQFIRDQLRMKLEVVKVALVQQNEKLYKASLADAKKWLEEQFTQNGDSKEFIKELDRLNSIKLRSQFPDISLSLKMLRDITKLRIETDKAIEPLPTSPSESGSSDNTSKSPEIDKSSDDALQVAPVTGSTQTLPTAPEKALADPDEPAAESKPLEANHEDVNINSDDAAMSVSPAQPAVVDPAQTAKPNSDPSAAGHTSSEQAPVAGSGDDASHAGQGMPQQTPDDSSPDDGSQPASHDIQPDAPKPSPVLKLLETLKQYLPGNH